MSSRRDRRRRTVIFLSVGLAMSAFGVLVYALGVFNRLERQTIDSRFSIRGEQRPPANIVFIAIDGDTLTKLGKHGEHWPIRRRWHARLIHLLEKGGAKTIGYDVAFADPSDPVDDNQLYDAVSGAGNVVLAADEVRGNGQTRIFGGNANVRAAHARVANVQLPIDSDGIWRRMTYETFGLKSFAIVVAERYLGHSIPQSRFPGSTAWIDYAGPNGTVPTIPFWHVLSGKINPSVFRGKIVIVGSIIANLQDSHPTPTTQSMPGSEIQANAISTVLRGFPLRDAPTAINILLILLLGLIAPLAGLKAGPIIGTAIGVGGAGLFAVATQLSFNHGRIISFVYPLTALVLSTVGALGAHYVLVAFERQRVHDMFSRFVPEGVVDQVLARTDSDLRLGGVELVVTVMFSDLRGFTSSAEHMSAVDVIEVLNHYLGEMSDAILDHGGTLVSYMGDGIMALFGAPIEQPDHGPRSFAAAREMLEVRLPRFNEWMRDRGLGEGYRMGIGLNTGPVMSGNVGHERRLEYTAVGDTTNTASRIEGMTKGTPYSLFVAESTFALLEDPPPNLVFHEEVEVRGRQQKLKIWGWEPELAPAAEPAAEPVPAAEPEPVEAPAGLEPV